MDASRQSNLHLNYLDGIRGLAALFVVMSHAFNHARFGFDHEAIPQWLRYATFWGDYGHYAVVVFIVLSGYCLTIPVVKSSNKWVNGGIKQYVRRRALRILPPYYAAILFALIILTCLPEIQSSSSQSISWKQFLPAFRADVLLAHLFLIHNLSPTWIHAIISPVWSIATEWQLYFTLPLLIMIWQRLGLVSMVIISISLGYALNFIFPQLESGCPWFLGCFAMGMAGAVINFSIIKPSAQLYSSKITYLKHFRKLIIAFAILFVLLTVLKIDVVAPRALPSHLYFADTLVGIITTTILIFLTYYLQIQQLEPQRAIKKPVLLKLFETQISLRLGAFSYSLYLIHDPIFCTVQFLTNKYRIGIVSTYAITAGIGVPIAVGLAYIFYCMVERPMLNLRSSVKKISSCP